jgi:O-antigen/teichoic acid export membrane protein
MADQGIVSAANFLVTVLIGRTCGKAELGIYSLGFSVVVLALSVLQSVVAIPYTVFVHDMEENQRRRYAGGSLLLCGIIAWLSMLGLAAWGSLASLGYWRPSCAPVIWVLAATIPFFLLREFGRRIAFAHLQMTSALAFDAAVAVLQAAALVALVVAGRLSAVTAYTATGLCCAAVAAVWFYSARWQFIVRAALAASVWRRNWAFAKWVLAEQTAQTMNAYVMYWLLATMLDVSATGRFAACATIMCVFNPVLLGLNNILMPRVAVAMSQGGAAEVRRVVAKATLVIVAVTSVFCVTIFVFGLDILQHLYGIQYAGQEGIVAVLAIDMLVSCLSMAPAYAIWAHQQSRTLFFIKLLRISVAVLVGICLTKHFGAIAAAYGLLTGSTVGTAATIWVHRRLLASQDAAPTTAPVPPEEEFVP